MYFLDPRPLADYPGDLLKAYRLAKWENVEDT
jgi:hypothetical protein